METLKKLLAQRTVATPALLLVIGIVLHAKGITLSHVQQDWMQQQVALVFDALALISGQSSVRFGLSQKKQEQIKKAVDINAKVANPLEDTGNQLPVTVEEVAKREAGK